MPTCAQCDYTFTQKGNPRIHTQVPHESMVRSCTLCDHKVRHRESVSTPIKPVHKSINFACKQNWSL